MNPGESSTCCSHPGRRPQNISSWKAGVLLSTVPLPPGAALQKQPHAHIGWHESGRIPCLGSLFCMAHSPVATASKPSGLAWTMAVVSSPPTPISSLDLPFVIYLWPQESSYGANLISDDSYLGCQALWPLDGGTGTWGCPLSQDVLFCRETAPPTRGSTMPRTMPTSAPP